MTLWKKTLLVIALSMGILGLTLYVIQRFLVLRSFAQLESQYARRDVERAALALNAEAERLDVLARDWAAWDDTYQFVVERNEAYRRSNLVEQTFVDAGINVVLIVDSAARIVFAQALDLVSRKPILVPEFAQESLQAGHRLLQHTSPESHTVGIMLLSAGPLLVASRPVITSQGQGPIRGSVILGRLVDERLMQSLAQTVQRPLSFRRADDPALPADFRQARAALSVQAPAWVHPLDAQHVAAYYLLTDLAGQPALILKAELPRDIYQHGLLSFRYLAAAIVLVGVQFWGVSVLLLERAVLARVKELGRQVSALGERKDLAARVSLTGSDEMGRLAAQINAMLSDLQQARESIRWRERYLEALARAAESLLTPAPDIPYASFLQTLGEAACASRVYVFLNQRGLAGELLTSLKAEWCAEGVAPLSADPRWQNLPFVAGGLERWAEVLARGDAINNLVADLPNAERALLEPNGVQAVLTLPLIMDGAFVGMIGFDQCATAREWEPAEADLLRTAAADLAQALKRKRGEKVQSALYRVSEAAQSLESLPHFFRAIHAIVGELMAVKSFYIALCDPAGTKLDFAYVVDEGVELSEPQDLGKELAGYVLRTGERLLVPMDVFGKLHEEGGAEHIAPPAVDWLGVPLKVQDRLVGVLAVHSAPAGAHLGAEEEEILTYIAAQAAMAVERRRAAEERARLEEQLRQDQRS